MHLPKSYWWEKLTNIKIKRVSRLSRAAFIPGFEPGHSDSCRHASRRGIRHSSIGIALPPLKQQFHFLLIPMKVWLPLSRELGFYTNLYLPRVIYCSVTQTILYKPRAIKSNWFLLSYIAFRFHQVVGLPTCSREVLSKGQLNVGGRTKLFIYLILFKHYKFILGQHGVVECANEKKQFVQQFFLLSTLWVVNNVIYIKL